MASYIDNEKHLPLEKYVLEVKVTQYKEQQTVFAREIIGLEEALVCLKLASFFFQNNVSNFKKDALPEGGVKNFWQDILSRFKFDQSSVDFMSELEDLLAQFDLGPMSRQIIATFRAIEHGDYGYVLERLREGVHVGSRDLTNYSLTHCAALFANVPILNVLIKSGTLFLLSHHFTPLNLVLLLNYHAKLKNIVIIKTEKKRIQMTHRIHQNGITRERRE